jgi:hypothetical protein
VHGGAISAHNMPGGGLAVVATLPLMVAEAGPVSSPVVARASNAMSASRGAPETQTAPLREPFGQSRPP